MSIAWIYRDDYARARYLVLPDSSMRVRIATLLLIASIIYLPALLLLLTLFA
jgi:heme O synthase-like polyprenyltransferase